MGTLHVILEAYVDKLLYYPIDILLSMYITGI